MAAITIKGDGRSSELVVNYTENYDRTKNETTLQVTSVQVYNTVTTNSNMKVTGEIVCNDVVIASFDGNAVRYAVDEYNEIKNATYSPVVLKHGLNGELKLSFHTKTSSATYPNYGGTRTGVYLYGGTSPNFIVQTFLPATIVETTATGKGETYKLTTTVGANTSLSVNRTSSPWGGDTGALENSDTIYYGDVLNITGSADSGYSVSVFTVNGGAFTSGGNHTVTDNVIVIITAGADAIVYIWNGSEWKKYMIYIFTNGEWKQYRAFVHNGTEFVPH